MQAIVLHGAVGGVVGNNTGAARAAPGDTCQRLVAGRKSRLCEVLDGQHQRLQLVPGRVCG